MSKKMNLLVGLLVIVYAIIIPLYLNTNVLRYEVGFYVFYLGSIAVATAFFYVPLDDKLVMGRFYLLIMGFGLAYAVHFETYRHDKTLVPLLFLIAITTSYCFFVTIKRKPNTVSVWFNIILIIISTIDFCRDLDYWGFDFGLQKDTIILTVILFAYSMVGILYHLYLYRWHQECVKKKINP